MTPTTYIERHRVWSLNTFGNGRKTEGILKHIAKELEEIRTEPTNLEEWVDVMILALDGAWRVGYNAEEILNMLLYKQEINFDRTWPTNSSDDDPTEHIKG